MAGYLIGLDMGGTNLRSGIVDLKGRVLLSRRVPAMANSDASTILRNLAEQIHVTERDARARSLGPLRAIGVAVPGPMTLPEGLVLAAPHVAAWKAFPLRQRLTDLIGRSVVVENDANAWALGELWRGVARNTRHAIVLTLGTGVGGGVIVDGAIVHGRIGMAGELGHVTVEPEGTPCDCGSRGCLEAYASSSGLKRMLETRYRKLHRELPRTFLEEGHFSVSRLAAEAKLGNRIAREAFATAGHYLGIAIASFINALNPEMVVIGGGIAPAMPLMREHMMLQVRQRAIAFSLRRTRITRAALGDSAGIVGVAYAAMRATMQQSG